jgi:vanillate O-demethylase monooxygenase subunit
MFPDVVEEDKFALEQQHRMFKYPDDGYQEVFLKPDLAIRRARVIFQDLMREQESAPHSVAAE